MRVLLASTEDFIRRGSTKVTADFYAGSNVVVGVINSAELAVNDYVVAGAEGADGSELCKITAVSPTTITLASVLFTHKTDDPITKYRYNKRKFYGCTTSNGTFLELTSSGSPADINVTDPQGTYLEYIGVEGYAYFKSTYYNSTTSEETSLVESNAVLGDESARYCSIYAIKKQVGLTKNPYITDGVVETYRKRAENEVDSYLNAKYTLPLQNSQGVPEVPFMIENVCTLLAAGYMDYQEFGKDGEGVKWLGEARAILKALQSPGGQQLLGSDHAEMMTNTLTSGVKSYPDTVDNENGPTRMFTTGQIF